MIKNATIIGYATPAVSDGLGGETAGTETTGLSIDVNVQRATRKQVVNGVDKLADAVAVMYTPPDFAAEVNGLVTYTVRGVAGERTLQVMSIDPWSNGGQSHLELHLRTPR